MSEERCGIGVTAFLICFLSSGFGQNTISVVRTDLNTIDLYLKNADPVAGIQLSIETSSHLALSEFRRGDRTLNPGWIVASYQPNDSTVNAIIAGSSQMYFPRGEGTIAKISYRFADDEPPVLCRVVLTGVVASSPVAEGLNVSVNNAEWDPRIFLKGDGGAESFMLGNNFPNPFNPETRIAYLLKGPARVSLSIFDLQGREVARLVDQYQPDGEYAVTWKALDPLGKVLPSGVYFTRLQVGNHVRSMKMILAR